MVREGINSNETYLCELMEIRLVIVVFLHRIWLSIVTSFVFAWMRLLNWAPGNDGASNFGIDLDVVWTAILLVVCAETTTLIISTVERVLLVQEVAT